MAYDVKKPDGPDLAFGVARKLAMLDAAKTLEFMGSPSRQSARGVPG